MLLYLQANRSDSEEKISDFGSTTAESEPPVPQDAQCEAKVEVITHTHESNDSVDSSSTHAASVQNDSDADSISSVDCCRFGVDGSNLQPDAMVTFKISVIDTGIGTR